MSSNSRAKTHKSAFDQILESEKAISELHSLLRVSATPKIGSRSNFGTARSASKTEGLVNPDVVFTGIISYTLKLLSMSSASIDISKATDTGFTSRLILANSAAFDLETIVGAEHAGQYLEIQGVVTESIIIKHGVGNIRTQSGADVTITGNQMVTLRFDSVANEWVVVTSPTEGLVNPDVVFTGIISYTLKLLSMSSASIDISKATDTGFTSRLILANSAAFDLETIVGAEHAGQYLEIQGVVTESIIIKHGVGNIRTQSGADVTITGNQMVTLRFDSVANEWVVVTSPTGGTTSFISFTADADLNMGSFDILNVDRFIPTIDSSVFPFTFTAGILLSAIGLHYNVASLKTHKFQEEEVDQLIITGVPGIGTSLQGNDLTEADDIFFTTPGTSILHDSSGIDFTLPFADIYEWFVNSVLEFTIGTSQVNFEGNDGFDLDDLFFTSGAELRTAIGDFQIRLPTGHEFEIYVNGVFEWEFSATSLDCKGNQFSDLASIFFSTSGNSIQTNSAGISYIVPLGDLHDFYYNFVSRMTIGGSIDALVDLDLNDNDIQKIKTAAIHENYAAGFAPLGVTDTAVTFCRPSGAGKTEYRVIFQTGISQLMFVEA